MRMWRILTAVGLALSAAQAGDLAVSVGAQVDSSYVFRGAKRGPFGVIGDVTLDYRFNKRLSLVGDIQQYVQIERGVSLAEGVYRAGLRYRPPLIGSLAALEGGITYYAPSGDLNRILYAGDNTGARSTQEWYLRTVFDLPFSPTIDLLHDFNERPGTYLRFSASRSQDLPGKFSLDLDGSVGLQFGQGIHGWRDGHVRGALWYRAAPGISFGPTLDLWIPTNKVDPGANSLRPVIGFGCQLSPKLAQSQALRLPRQLGPAF